MKADVIITAIRIPRDLHALIATLAQIEHRSANAQIITLIEEAFAARETMWSDHEDPS
jgi:hypothetical protein